MLEFNVNNQNTIIPNEAIKKFEQQLEDKGIPFYGYMFLHGKDILSKKFDDGFSENKLHRMYSITKSFEALAIGILIDQGKLSYTDRIVTYFPEMLDDNPHPWLQEMTIEDMLTMRTCHGDTTYKHKDYFEGDWTKSFFRVKPDHIPGTVFCYDTSSAQTLGALVEKLTGMDALDFLRKEAFDEIGFSKEAYIMKDPVGVEQGGSGMLATIMDVARVAYLFNHEGALDGKQLLPKEYVRRAIANQVPTALQPTVDERCGYGYMIWKTRRPGFVFYGMGGQLAVCFPQYDFIYMTIADTIGNGAGLQIIYDCFYDNIYPYLEEKFGKTEVIADKSKSEYAKIDDCVTYNFYENKFGFQKLILDFENNNLILDTDKQRFSLVFEEERWVEQIFSGTDYKCRCKAYWESKHLVMDTYIIDEELGHISLELAWKDEKRLSVRVRTTNLPFFYGFNGYVAAEII